MIFGFDWICLIDLRSRFFHKPRTACNVFGRWLNGAVILFVEMWVLAQQKKGPENFRTQCIDVTFDRKTSLQLQIPDSHLHHPQHLLLLRYERLQIQLV